MIVFSFHFSVLNKNEGKGRTFHGNSFFSLKIALIIPFPAFLGKLTSYLRKIIFILVQKKGIYAISRKNFLFTEKINFLMIFSLFHCFHQTINKKHWILPQYTFFLKKIINDVFFNVFRSINGILNKTPFYKYNICDLNYQFFNVVKGFTLFLCKIHLPLENKSMFLHPKVSFSVIFFEFPCFN